MTVANHHIPRRAFFEHAPQTVAKALLGALLIRRTRLGDLIGGAIVETEAYLADGDLAAHHIARGRTNATAAKFMRAGTLYIHRIHRHFCMDIVTQGVEIPSSVLVRAVEPVLGVLAMKKRRNTDDILNVANGPGKLCQALDIDGDFNCRDILDPTSDLQIQLPDALVPDAAIGCSPRIGLTKGSELELRFYLKDNSFVSGPKWLRNG